MTTRKLLFVIMFFVTSLGDNVFSQTMSVVSHKNKDVVFKFNSSINNTFLGMEMVNDDNYLIKGLELDPNGYENYYVSLASLTTGVCWEKKVFQAENSLQSFSGDICVYKTDSESLLYATTKNGVESYNTSGSVNYSYEFSGTKSKLVQKSDSNLLLTKILDGNMYLYKFVNNQIIDSILLITGINSVISRFYDSSGWYFTVRLDGIKTALLKVDANAGVVFQKDFINADRSWVYVNNSRIYVVSSVFNESFKYRTRLTCFSKDGEQMWDKIFIPASAIDEASSAKNVTFFPENEGCSITGIAGGFPYVASFDMNGVLLWEKALADENNRSPVSITWNGKKELVLGGRINNDCYLSSYYIEGVTTAIDDPTSPAPQNFVLNQNYPNPFNPTTKISYSLPTSTQVQLVVYNQLGEVVSELVNGYENSGSHEVTFDGSGLASGMYFARLIVGANAQTKKMVLIK